MSSEKRNYKGSCACGYVKYEVALPTPMGNLTRCNCSYCTKFGTTNIRETKDDFKLITPDSIDKLSDYKHRRFCPTCSVIIIAYGSYEFKGQTYHHFSVNAGTIDQPQEGLDLSKLNIKYTDGLNDNWEAGVLDKPYPGGLI